MTLLLVSCNKRDGHSDTAATQGHREAWPFRSASGTVESVPGASSSSSSLVASCEQKCSESGAVTKRGEWRSHSTV
jgi:hypothetical protein